MAGFVSADDLKQELPRMANYIDAGLIQQRLDEWEDLVALKLGSDAVVMQTPPTRLNRLATMVIRQAGKRFVHHKMVADEYIISPEGQGAGHGPDHQKEFDLLDLIDSLTQGLGEADIIPDTMYENPVSQEYWDSLVDFGLDYGDTSLDATARRKWWDPNQFGNP